MSYLKNVGKSIGYAIPAIIEDKFKDLSTISKMVANPKEFKSVFKDSVKDMLNDTSSDMNSEIIAPIKKMYSRAEKAAKTGKYFRSEKERTASAFEAFGGDFNMDFDFNTESLESSMDESTNATYENTNAIYESGVMQVATTTRATKSITSELSRLSSLTYELSKLQTELTRTQISEAGRYYASSLGFLGEMTESMSTLKNEMVALRMVSAPPDIFKGPNAQKYYEVLTASNFNMRSYFNYLGKKVKDSSGYSMLSMAGMMGSMMDPVEEAVKAMFSPITNSKFGKRMQALNTAIAGSPLFILRSLANKDFGTSFFGQGMSSLFKFLNVDYLDSEKHVSLKTDIRTVPWDAESKRSLVQVIPNLLSRILSAVKKEDFSKKGLIFDPNTGKYIKMQELGDRMKETVDKATDYDSFSQNEIIKKMRESQTFTGATEEAKNKQKKSFDNQLYKLLDAARLAGGGNFDINKAISEGRYTSPKEIELAKHMHEQFFSNLSVDKYNSMLELLNHHEARKDNIIGTIKGLYEDKKDKFGTAERQFEGNLFDEISKKYYNIDNKKIKDLRNNNGGNGDSSNDNNNNGGGGNPPANDSFFDKMRKLIDGSYLFTKLNGFLDTISEKTSKFIFGDDTFVGPQKSFFEKLKDGIKDKIDKFSEIFSETFKPLKDYFTKTLIPNLSNAFQGIKKYLVDDIYKGIMGSNTLTGQGGIITNIKESIKNKYKKGKEYLFGAEDNMGNRMAGKDIEGAFKRIYKSLGFESIFNKFKDGVRSLGDVLKENTEKLAKFFNKHLFEDGGLLKGLGDKISTFFKDTTDTIKKDVLTPLKEFLVGDDGILTKAKENIKQNILSPIKDFFIDKDNGIFNDAFKLKFRNTFIQPIEDFFLGKGDNKQNIFKRLMGRLNKDMFFGKEKKYNVNGIQATAGGMFGDSNSFLYKFLFGTSSVDAAGKVNKNTKGLIDNISEKGVSKFLIEKLSETVFKPFSKYLIGDEAKPGILRKFATYLDDNIANPIKNFLFGDENKEGALDKFKNSFNIFLFGDGTDKRKGLIGDYLKPATDFLKVELMDPFLATMRTQWLDMKTFFREGVLEPLMTSFDGLGTSIGIKISKLGKQGKDFFVDAFKSTLEITNEAIGNMLSGSSKTLTEMMKENVLDPIKSTLDKLRLGIWSILKGIIKIPVNAFSAVTDRIKIADLLKGDGGHLSAAQQARLLEVHNKSLREKDRLDGWGKQKEYFGEDGEPKKKGFWSSIFDRTHDKVREREEKAAKETKDNKSGSKISLDRSEDYKKNKMLKDISTKESANDIKNLSENSDKSTKTLSEVLEVLKNPIPEITTNIKDIKDGILNYIREHSLSGSKDTTSSSSSDKSTEDKEKTKELKESKKEIKSTNGLLTDIRDGIDTMIHILSGGKDGASSREGANLRGKRRFGGGSIGRILEGLILDPLGMIRSVFEGGFKAITDSIGSVFKIVTEPLVQLTKTIGTGVREFFKLIGKTGGLIDGISNIGGKVLTGLGDLISGVSGGIRILLEDGAEIFGGIAKDLGIMLGDISVSLGKVISSTVDILEGITKTLKPLTDFMFKFIGQTIGLLGSGILGGMKVAKWGAEKTGGWLLRRLGVDIGKDSNLIKRVSIDGGMLTGISDVVKVFVVGGNLDGISNKVNSGGMDTSKLSSDSKSGENLKDVVNKTKVDLTRPDDYKKKKDSKTGGIKESLVNMRDNTVTKLKDLRDKLMLSNSSKTVEHLSEIRKDSKGLVGMLIWALPALVGGVGSLLSWLGISSLLGLIRHPIAGLGKIGAGIKNIPSKVGGVVTKVKASPEALKGWWGGREASRASMTGGVTEAREATVGMKQKLLDTKTNITEGFNNKKVSAKKWWSGESARSADMMKGDIGSKGKIGARTKLSNAKMNLDSSKLGRKAFDVKGLKGLGVGLALAGTGYVADKYMEEGFTKDLLVAGSDIAGYAMTGAAIGSFIPLIGNAIGGTIGAMYGITQNLGRIANIGKATWTFIAGKGAEFDENGNMVKESELSIFDRIFGNKEELDEKGNVLEKSEESWWFKLNNIISGYSEQKDITTGQTTREGFKGLKQYTLDFINDFKIGWENFGTNLKKGWDDFVNAFVINFDWENLKQSVSDSWDNFRNSITSAIDSLVPDWLSDYLDRDTHRTEDGIGDKLRVSVKNRDAVGVRENRGVLDSLTNTNWFEKDTIDKSSMNNMTIDNARLLLDKHASEGNLSDESVTKLRDYIKMTVGGGEYIEEGYKAPIKRAKGGIVLGKGTETSDSIDAKLSNNEYVLNAKAVKAIGKPTLDKINKLDKTLPTDKDNLKELDNIYYGGEYKDDRKRVKRTAAASLVAGSFSGMSLVNNLRSVIGKGGLASLAYLGKYVNGMYNEDGLLKDSIDVGLDVAGSGLTGSMIGPYGTIAGTAYGLAKNEDKMKKIGGKAHSNAVDYTSENIIPAIANFFMNNDSFFSDIKRNIDATSKGIDNFFFGKDAKYDKNGKLISRKEDGLIKKTGEIFTKLGTWFDGLLNSKFFKSISDTVSNIGQSVVAGAKEAYRGAVDYTSQNIIPGAVDKYNSITKVGGSTKNMMGDVLNAFKKAGFSGKQALALSAEVGRENGYNEKNVFGSHTDAANGVRNTGFFSWQGNRSKKLMERLAAKGLVDKSGNMVHSQEALNEMALFAKEEMSSGQYKGLGDFMNNKDISADDAAKKLGKGYIKWAYGQDVLRNGTKFDWRKHDSKRAGYYGQLEKMQGSISDLPNTDNSIAGMTNNAISKENLRIKGKQATAGGHTHEGTFALANVLQQQIPELTKFNAFDDEYHHSAKYFAKKKSNKMSTHALGTALDFSIPGPSKNNPAAIPVAEKVRSLLKQYGIKGEVIDEYNKPSKGSTGGHIHVNFASVSEASKFQSIIGGKGIGEQLLGQDSEKRDSKEDSTNNLGTPKMTSSKPISNEVDIEGAADKFFGKYSKPISNEVDIEGAADKFFGTQKTENKGFSIGNIIKSIKGVSGFASKILGNNIPMLGKVDNIIGKVDENISSGKVDKIGKKIGDFLGISIPNIRGINGDIEVPKGKVDYNNISSNSTDSSKNIAITNASTDEKGLAIKDSIDRGNNINIENSKPDSSSTNSRIEALLASIEYCSKEISKNTGDMVKKDFNVKIDKESKDTKVNNSLFNVNNRLNPYASYTDNRPNENLNKRLEQANKIAKGV